MSAVWIEQSFERVRKLQLNNSMAKSIKAKTMEFTALDNQPFSVVGDVCTGTHYQVRYFSDVTLLELHSNSVTAISFTTDILWNAVWVFACQKGYSSTVKAVQKSLQTRPRTMCLQYRVGNKA